MHEMIQLKPDLLINKITATKGWKKGVMISTVTMADNIGYAVIRTEHGEYDLVPFYAITHRVQNFRSE